MYRNIHFKADSSLLSIQKIDLKILYQSKIGYKKIKIHQFYFAIRYKRCDESKLSYNCVIRNRNLVVHLKTSKRENYITKID